MQFFRKVAFALLLVVSSVATGLPAFAQQQSYVPPVVQSVDARGVDIVSGTYHFTMGGASVGQPGAGGLSFSITSVNGEWRDALAGTINSSGSTYTVSIGGVSETFTESGGTYTSDQRVGSTLEYSGGDFVYTTSDGTEAIFTDEFDGSEHFWEHDEAVVSSITRPNSEVVTYNYNSATVSTTTRIRIQSVTNNFGYMLHFDYADNSPANVGELTGAWMERTQVLGINLAVDYCSATANTCSSLTETWPVLEFDYFTDGVTFTDTLGRETHALFDLTNGGIAIAPPGAELEDDLILITVLSGTVSEVENGGGSWEYEYDSAGGFITLDVTQNDDERAAYKISPSTGRIAEAASFLDSTNDRWTRTAYTYDSYGRVTETTLSGDNAAGSNVGGMTTEYTYDARGNVTEIEEIQDGQSSGIVVFEASYPGSCTNTLTCNQPTWAEDAAGNRTNYAYNSTHGGVTSVQPPDPDGGGSLPRPETRFAYDSFQAYYRTGSSTWGSGAAVYLVEEISACQTTASCDGAADENVTTFDYGPSASANNLLPVEVTTDEGDGGDAVTVAATYDHNGNALEIDGPLSGTADTTAYVYDVGRRVVGVIGPDPDGGGALVHRARRFTYNTQGRIELTEIGTTEGYTSTNWSNFSVLDESETEFDDYARAIESEGAPQAIIQTSYTADDQVECRAVRMNPAVYTSLPSSACTLSTEGTYGPDQITKYVYNDAGLIIQVRSAVGTSLEQVTQSYTYNAFGQVDTVTDANGNMTTYEFDGYHRPTKTRYPHPTSTGTSSTTDYEQLSYDAYGRVSSERRRDGTSFSFTYDNLGRVTDRDHSSVSTLDKTFTYDNFGQVTSTSQWWQTLTYEYDIHGRVTEEEHNYLGAVASQYDAAGRRTRVDYPGPNSFYVTYEYDVTGAMTKVRQQGSTVLATYAYDDLGRRVSLTRGNGAVTTYDYDAYQRLDELDHDLSGSTYDQTETFAYTPSGQLATRDATNDIYDASAPSGFSDDYDVDGLNQYTDIATLTPSYDSRGNMTSDGAASYTFDNDNRLVEAGSIDLTYDPLDRLYATNDSANTRFLFDGPHLASEKDNTGAVLRRYVYGASLDEPLVWYEGDDYSERYWFVSNRQGTIVAITNASGAVTNVNAYDDYGAPESALAGTFGLNGALWLSQTGLYHMRARAYDPRIGRFVSPDPIGYGDGMNMYAYVGNDPINRWDPMGLEMSGFPSLNNHEHCEYFMSQTACAYIWGEIDDPGYIGFTGSGRNNSICVSTPALCEPHSVQSLKQVISELNAALSQITQQTPPAALPENSGAFIGTTTGAEFGDIVSAMIAAAMTIVNFSDNGFYEYGVTFDVTQSGHIEVGVFQRGPRGGGRVRVSIGSSTVGWLHNHPSSGNAALDRVNREPSCCGRDTDVRETQRIMKHFDRSEFMVGIIGPDDVLRIWTYVWPESGQ